MAAGQGTFTMIGDSDEHVLYSPSPQADQKDCKNRTNRNCFKKWWSEDLNDAYKNSVKTTWGRDTSFQLQFRGSGISVLGVTDVDGAGGFFTMDSEAASVTASFHSDARKLNQTVFNQDGLDDSVPHTLHFTYDDSTFKSSKQNRSLIRIDSFIIRHPEGEDPFAPPVAPPSIPPAGQPASSDTSGLPLPSTGQTIADSTGLSPTSTASITTGTPIAVGSNPRATSAVVPVVAGLVTGFATLVIAGSLIFFFLRRRRRAVRVQSMSPPARSSAGPASPTSPTAGGRAPRNLMSLATYAFTRRGSSVTSSADSPPRPVSGPPPPVPQITQYVSPYNYHRPVTYPHSDASTSLGPPVDERPPNIPHPPPVPLSPARAAPRVLRVYNPDSRSAVSSNYSGG